MCACAGAEGRGFSLKRPDKGSEALQLHQYPLVHLLCKWTRPGERLYADILAATGLNGVSERGILSVFGSYGVVFLYCGAPGQQTERCLMAKNTWYGPPLGGSRPLEQLCYVLTELQARPPA